MKPLDGYRILDLTQFFAGPVCTLFLSDLGAEVIKFERPGTGDVTRHRKILIDGKSSLYATRNRGKKSVVLDFKDPGQRDLFLALVKTADAVIENYKPGTMEHFGITYDLLQSLNPKIVYTRISGYGQTGPYAHHAAYDATIQAESGLISVTGEDASSQIKCGACVADYCGGLNACIGTLSALLKAQRTGHGECVDVSMMESLLLLQENMLTSYFATREVPHPIGNRYPAACPFNTFLCKDGIPVMINIVTDEQFIALAEVLEQPEWIQNPDYRTAISRVAHTTELEAKVQAAFSKITSDDAIARLESRKLAYGRVNDYAAVAEHPQVKARHSFVDTTYPGGATFHVPAIPIRMNGFERETQVSSADLGQHTWDILSEVADTTTLHRILHSEN